MSWEPHTLTTVELLDPSPVTALNALLDSGHPAPVTGEVLPPLWHWVALPRWSPSSVLDLDGHPRRGGFLPPLELPRRMFAGGEVTLEGDLRVGAQVVRESTVTLVQEKQGRSGPLGLVQVTTRLIDPASGDVLLRERQDIIYREAASAPDPESLPDSIRSAQLGPAGPPLALAEGGWRFLTDPTLLMRFSAATANAHRIHYDWPYATRVEGYPDLVVHGPLSTLILAEAVRLAHPDQRVSRLTHRNMLPLFCGDDAHVTLRPDSAEHVDAVLQRPDGTQLSRLTVQTDGPVSKGDIHAQSASESPDDSAQHLC